MSSKLSTGKNAMNGGGGSSKLLWYEAGSDPERSPFEKDVEKIMNKHWDTLARFERAFLVDCFGLKIPAVVAVVQVQEIRAFLAACTNLKEANLDLDRPKIKALMAVAMVDLPSGFAERGLGTS